MIRRTPTLAAAALFALGALCAGSLIEPPDASAETKQAADFVAPTDEPIEPGPTTGVPLPEAGTGALLPALALLGAGLITGFVVLVNLRPRVRHR